jgi:hypothetical protein
VSLYDQVDAEGTADWLAHRFDNDDRPTAAELAREKADDDEDEFADVPGPSEYEDGPQPRGCDEFDFPDPSVLPEPEDETSPAALAGLLDSLDHYVPLDDEPF